MPRPKYIDAFMSAVTIRDLNSYDDLKQVEAVDREVWQVNDRDLIPVGFAVAARAAGSLYIGAFDGPKLIGFAFGIFGVEHGRLILHSHQLAVLPGYRDS